MEITVLQPNPDMLIPSMCCSPGCCAYVDLYLITRLEGERGTTLNPLSSTLLMID